jgi:hypothetical protein
MHHERGAGSAKLFTIIADFAEKYTRTCPCMQPSSWNKMDTALHLKKMDR